MNRPAAKPTLPQRLKRMFEALFEGRAPRAAAARGISRARAPRARFDMRLRLGIVLACMGVASISLVARAAYVQLVDKDFYQKEGDARTVREIEIPVSRGMITDRNGEPLAISSPVESVWCDPKELLKDGADRLPELAQALGETIDSLGTRVSQHGDKEFMYLKRRINPDDAKAIVALGVPGVYSKREYRRFYPQGDAMAHVLGFTSIDDEGQEGVELAFDEWLRGKPGMKKVVRDRDGHIVENLDLIEPAVPGKDLTLSIDRRIQYLTFKELKRQIEQSGAASGSAVVLDVATGEVLAMANWPSFNPNMVEGSNREAHRNRAVTDLFEPGSTMKPITVATALEDHKITPNTIFDTSPGWMPNGKFTTTDTHNYGVLDVTGIIRKSSNVGASKIALRLDNQEFYDSIRRFGYGQSTHSGFPGEAAGLLPPPARWSGTTKQTMSYGYGIAVTPLQVAHAYVTLANGGREIQPSFVKGAPVESKQVLDPKVAHEVLKMMQTVTEAGGTAYPWGAILGYHVAGKTGTANKASNGGYAKHYDAFFAGMVPVDNPRFAMAVVINDPSKGSHFGGPVAGPVFHNVMDGALRLMDVPPDDINAWLAAQAKGSTKLPVAPAEPEDDAALDATIPGAAEDASLKTGSAR